MVAREGLEPSKPLGRQIYSLLRLTASLPRQLTVYWKTAVSVYLKAGEFVDGAGEGIRTPDLLITNQLLYQTELRQPRQKVNFSTSRATLQLPAGLGDPGAIQTLCRPGAGSLSATTTSHCTHFRTRWRTASNKAIPVATDTFRL